MSGRVQFEYNVQMYKQTRAVCSLTLILSTILYLTEICIEILLILQWINVEYFIPVFLMSTFILLSNIGNIYQWHTFSTSTRWNLHYLSVLCGAMGLLPWISMVYYLCTATCCARMGICRVPESVTEMSAISGTEHTVDRRVRTLKAKQSNRNDCKSQQLLPAEPSSTAEPSSITIPDGPLSNLTQLWAMQLAIRYTLRHVDHLLIF